MHKENKSRPLMNYEVDELLEKKFHVKVIKAMIDIEEKEEVDA